MRGINYGTKTPAWHYRRSRVIGKAAIRFATPFLPLAILLVVASLAVVAIVIHERKQNAIHQAKMKEFDSDRERARQASEERWRKFNEGFMKPEDAMERASQENRLRVLPGRFIHHSPEYPTVTVKRPSDGRVAVPRAIGVRRVISTHPLGL
jgi:hypothetical protein